ncbi:Alpha-2-macroglobulin RAP protein [Trichostrongylus colubriformis]|uniref:Alpha-2-macroglobulin RAP protein n=1 Tax=Trichostrongylus colubriformis TaxID=6319 RepID=A0AAN8FES9_TRICO
MLIRWLHICITMAVVVPLLSLKYRSEKVNYIYEKALQHIADRKRLQKLEGELNNYDKVYMDTKADHKSRSAQEFASQMEKIDKKLVKLLEKYDLQQAVHAFKEKMKHKNEITSGDHVKVSELESFDDERLQQLWETAKNGKFSDMELVALHGELKDAERKTRVYEDSLQQMNKIPMENSIHFDDHPSLDTKKAQLKKVHREMSDHIEQLHQKIKEDNKSPFENDRVKRLWKTAQMNGNFTQKDIDILKDELLHFDKQLKKFAFHKKELDARREDRQKQGKMTLHAVEDVELEAKHEKIERKLRKLEKYLDSKIRHSEL